MIRKSIHELDEVFKIIKGKGKVKFHGDMINISNRLLVFKNNQFCSKCGIKGIFFAKEKNRENETFHLNFYALTKNGKEILMTKDHIIPRSLGGRNHLENYQTMCYNCNQRKSNRI